MTVDEPTGSMAAAAPADAGVEVRPADGSSVSPAGAAAGVRPGGVGSVPAACVAAQVRSGGVGSAASTGTAVETRPGGVVSVPPTGAAVSSARIGVIVSSARPEATPGASWWRSVLPRLNSSAVRTHFGTVAGVVILGALLWRLGTGVLLDGLRRIDAPTLLAALLIGVVTTVLSAWRWALVARGLRIRLPLGPAVADYYRALFLNAALPGGVLGDVHRAVRHGQSSGDMGRGVRSVVLERVAGQVALTVVGGAVLLTMPSPVLGEVRDFAPLVALAAVGALAVVVALRMNAAPSRRGRALHAALAEAREGLLSRRNWPGVVVSSLLVLAGHIAMFVLAARVAGSGASVAALLPLAVLALIAMGLPLNVGGFGPREGVAAWAFGAAGLGASSGVAVSVVYGVLSFVAALPGLVVLVARWYTGLRAGSGTAAAPAPEPARERDYPRALPAFSVSPDSPSESSAEVRSEKYAPKESARAASSSFPFSAEPSEGRPMTPESV
ncbi:lysylphosphatidylglycerol synthase transmembrane domain-containing protein [Streptomyces coacervatus]|uniref:lysylphosphatidylglycerol synthase transmembrane domain-containing protein n=1 Tax=Streptomyces coacervatus TaxID=647381 RepID=UPI003CD0A8F3